MANSSHDHTRILKKADHYDDPNYNYQDYWQGREYEDAAEKMAIERLLDGRHFKHAIDVGGGYGRLSILLSEYADTVSLVEPSKQQLKLAEHYIHNYPSIVPTQMQADNLQFADGSVDLVAIIRVLHHIPNPTAELAEISRILSDDGCAIIEAANYSHVRNRLKHLIHRKKMPEAPVDISSHEDAGHDDVPFVNHNPKTLIKQINQAGMKVERILSVSNLRSSGIKKIMPKRVMLAIEGLLQPTLAHGYFGPSVFFLVKKADESQS